MITTISNSVGLDSEVASRKFTGCIRIKVNNANGITLTVSTTGITINGNNFVYINKSLNTVINEINAFFSNQLIECFKLIDIGSNLLSKGSLLYVAGDKIANDYIIRYIGVIYKYNENANIRLLPPASLNQFESWYPRITNGSFKARFSNANFNGYYGINPNTNYIFGVPEFKYQDWSFKYGPPYKDVVGESPAILSYNSKIGLTVLRLQNKPICNGSVSIRIRNDFQNNSIIKYVDTYNGLVYLAAKIDSQIPISVDYSYEETAYTYDGIDVNITLSHNPIVSDTYIAFYLKPVKSDNGLISGGNSIFHEVLNTNLAGKLKTARIIPSTKNTPNPIYEPIIYLGAINVRHSSDSKKIEIVDTRSRGGGIFEDDIASKNALWRHSEFYWDINPIDGIPVPGNAGIVIKLPEGLKDLYTREEIRTRASKDVALGVVPIFDGLET